MALPHKVLGDPIPSSSPATTPLGVALVIMVWDDPATTSFKQKLGKRVAIRARDTCELSLGKEAHACREPSAYILLASTESIATASCKLSREIAKSSIILQEGKNSY